MYYYYPTKSSRSDMTFRRAKRAMNLQRLAVFRVAECAVL
jgi:hypothetical protein